MERFSGNDPLGDAENSGSSERRSAPRYALTVSIDVDGGSGTTANVSATGVYFETTLTLQPDQRIAIVFPFEHAAPGTRVACSARVLRVSPLPHGRGVAAQYERVAFEVPHLLKPT